MKIAMGGFQHETNTFAPHKADFAAFESTGGWPGLCRGAEMLAGVDGVHLPITGAIGEMRSLGHELTPLLWACATPCAQVTEDAFERIAGMLLADLATALPVDGIYLDLHGAMVCEHLEDGEGELLSRVRALVGNSIPISVSFDLHANLSAKIVEHASAVDIYRTYPHVDMGETGARAARHLHALLTGDGPWYRAFRQPDFLIPLNWGCTLVDPAKSLYGTLLDGIDDQVTALAFACGFPLSDIADVGPSIVACARSEQAANRAVDRFLETVNASEDAFSGDIYAAQDAVERAKALAATHIRGPVVLADTQDNPGGGGPGDTVGMLRALVEGEARGAVFGTIADAEFAARAHAAGRGGRFQATLGERSGLAGHSPYVGEFHVLEVGDGKFTATGPMFVGTRMELGPMALVDVDGVRVVVASKPVQTADQSIFRHLGIEPTGESIIALKSSVHFRADFQPIAAQILIAASPGPVYADPGALSFKRIRPGVRLRPAAKPLL